MGNNPRMRKALKKANITMEKLASKLGELLDAQHPAYEGKPDNPTQMKALELGVRLYDAAPNPKLEIAQRTENITVHITADLVKAVQAATGIKVIDVEPDERPKGYFPEAT